MGYVVLTGGTGFIGSWLVKELVEQKKKCILLVRNIKDVKIESTEYVTAIAYQSNEYEALKEQKENIDMFYHLAWGGVSTEEKNNTQLQLNNIAFSLNMLEYAKEIGANKFIGIGTVAEYSFCENIMDVNAKQTPNDMYGAAKTATHYMLETKARLLNMPFVWTVVPSTFGEGRNDSNIITYTIISLLKGDKPSFGSLEQMWDFLYVKEVARALFCIGYKGSISKTYAIGSGKFKPLKDYIIQIRDIIDPQLPLGIGELPTMSEKVFSSCVSIYDLTKDTGFEPEITFEEGIKKTILFYKEKLE